MDEMGFVHHLHPADHYQRLRLQPDTTTADILKAYTRLSKQEAIFKAESDARVQLLNDARDTLSDALKRKKYDSQLRGGSRTIDCAEEGHIQLSARHGARPHKRKRSESCCEVCGQDCISDGKSTLLCEGESCLKECHVDCVGARETWSCPGCNKRSAAGTTTAGLSPEDQDEPIFDADAVTTSAGAIGGQRPSELAHETQAKPVIAAAADSTNRLATSKRAQCISRSPFTWARAEREARGRYRDIDGSAYSDDSEDVSEESAAPARVPQRWGPC